MRGFQAIKPNLRRKLIQQRKELKPEQVHSLSFSVCQQILSHPVFIQSQTIAFYYPINNEVDLLSLVNMKGNPKTFLLPYVLNNSDMEFRGYTLDSELVNNKYGIPQPENSQTVISSQIDLCLMPLVGYHRNGSRLGYGGGFYDRYFSNSNNKQKTKLAGVAYNFQQCPTLKSDNWDIPMDIIFTNNETIEIKHE